MRLTVTQTGTQLLIRGYSQGRLRIGDQDVDSPVILSPRELRRDFRPDQPASILESDLEDVFALAPEVVIIGWAGGQSFLPAAQRRWFLERGIGLEVMELGAACRTYNVLVADGRAVVALLFP